MATLDTQRAVRTRTAFLILLGALFLSLLAATPALAAPAFPDVIPLPNGFQPEGIAVGHGATFYAGSLVDGAIYSGSLRTGSGDILVPGAEGRVAAGLAVDERSNILFVSGATTGMAWAYDAGTGEELAAFSLAAPGASFINDVVVTRQAAYFTNSFAPYIYRVPLGPGGSLPNPTDVEAIELTGEWDQQAGPFVFNANGIEATADGKWLIVINSSLGALYRVDPATGDATLIDLGGADVAFGDGLYLQGNTLYVVQNQLNQIAVVELSRDLLSGQVVDTITSTEFDVPTTAAMFGSSLYAVNARFGTTPAPDTEYWITKVPRN